MTTDAFVAGCIGLVHDAANDRGVTREQMLAILTDFGGIVELLDFALACRCYGATGGKPNHQLDNQLRDLDGTLRLAETGESRRSGTVAAGSADDLARV